MKVESSFLWPATTSATVNFSGKCFELIISSLQISQRIGEEMSQTSFRILQLVHVEVTANSAVLGREVTE